MSIEENKQFVERFFEAMNTGDVATMIDSYCDDGYLWTKGHTLISGRYSKEQVQAAAGAIYEAFPEGIAFDILHLTAEGDRVAVEATSSGMHVSGRLYENEYHFLFQLRDGKVLSLREYMDTERVTDVLCGGQRPE